MDGTKRHARSGEGGGEIVLLAEPTGEVRELIAVVVSGTGLRAVAVEHASDPDVDAAAVLIVEPANPTALAAAQALRKRLPELAIVCVSIRPPSPASIELEPVAHLMKPFPLAELSRALEAAARAR